MTFKLSRRSGISLIVLVVLSAGCCFYVFKAATVRLVAQSEAQATPFVLERNIYFYQHNPSGTLALKETIARRPDGATVRLHTVGPLAKGVYVRTIQYLDGSSVDLADFLRIKTTWPQWDSQAATWKARILHAPRNCVFKGDTLLEEGQTLLGQKVAVIKLGPPGGHLITSWRAPDLGCQELQYRIEDPQPGGSYKLAAEGKAVSLKLLEPEPALFNEGPDYAEVRPSGMEGRIGEWLGQASVTEEEENARASFDRNYDARWASQH